MRGVWEIFFPINIKHMAVIGVDLGGTKVAAAIFDHFGNIKAKEMRLLDGAQGDKVGKLVSEVILSLMEGNPRQHIKAIGVCVPGIVYSKKNTVWAPNIPGWDNYHLKRRIEAAIQNPKIKISIESDRTCYVLGEVWKGGAKGCQNVIYLAVGTGIGGGILIDGRVLHGHSDIVGATGWMALQNPYHPDYIPCGCFEHYASGNGIALQAQKALMCEKNYSGPLQGKPLEEVTSRDVFAAYEEGDLIACKVLDKAIEMWGMGAANLVSLFNPEKFIFGGGVFGPAAQFIPRIYDEACKWGQPISMKQVKFSASKVDGEAALYGAGYLAIRESMSGK